jgi:uncharacterized protein YuzE
MDIEYTKDVDAAYVQLVEEIGAGGVAMTYPCDPTQVNGEINLDFDHNGLLVGIEILDASRLLRRKTLDQAHPIGTPPRSQPSGVENDRT